MTIYCKQNWQRKLSLGEVASMVDVPDRMSVWWFDSTLLLKFKAMTNTSYQIFDHTPMPFGRHKGKRMDEVPAKYLLWVFNEGCTHPALNKYLNDNLAALQKEAGQTMRR